jgi:outer membrane protein
MKMIKTLLSIAAVSLIAGTASAQMKIGLIDLRKVFDDYYKTKAADTLLKDQAADLEKQKKTLIDQYQKATEDYKKALDDSNNQAVSADEREKRKKSAETSLLEIKRMEDQITQFDRTARTTLDERKDRMREKILEEIRTVVTARAKAGNFSMVLDTASESFNKTPILLYSNGENDMTTSVLSQLNASEPATPRASDKKDDKK